MHIFLEHVIPFLVAFSVSVVLCGLLVATRHLHVEKTTRGKDLSAVQAMHEVPAPRIAGLCIFAGIVLAVVMVSPNAARAPALLLLLSAAPAFLAGLVEDLGGRVSVRGRLASAAVSALAAILLLEIWIPPFHLPGLDVLTGIAPFAIGLTVLWSAGVCHAFNLIDGVNGLSGATGVLIATALTAIAITSGAAHLAPLAVITAAALVGFLLFNWPSGLIFMGDAGAYAIGHVLVWMAILLAWQDPSLSPIALSLLFFWPVADTFLAIWRRFARGAAMGQPDKLHFHQLVMRAILVSFRDMPLRRANALTAVCILPFSGMPVLAGFMLSQQPGMALMAWVVFGLLFTSTYLVGMWFFRHMARRRRRGGRHAPVSGPAVLGEIEQDEPVDTDRAASRSLDMNRSV